MPRPVCCSVSRKPASQAVAVVAALDTKAEDAAYVCAQLALRGLSVLVVDTSILADPPANWSAPRAVLPGVIAAAGGSSLAALRRQGDRGQAVAVMSRGVARVMAELVAGGRCAGVIGLGGGSGTAIGTAAMRELPLGLPKVMVSTLAGSSCSTYVGCSDIVMVPSIVDIAGINRISARVYAQAVGALAGMLAIPGLLPAQGPAVCASMSGNTTPAVTRAGAMLRIAGCEMLVFHATGSGGRSFEKLISQGGVQGVLDMTLCEIANELLGGVLLAGPDRLTAAGRAGIPQVVVPGCLDFVNFWEPGSVPDHLRGRRMHAWNPHVTLMRTTPAENQELGRIVADRLIGARAPSVLLLPLRGLSLVGAPGGPLAWPEADAALFESLHRHAGAKVPIIEIDAAINEPAFAERAAEILIGLIHQETTCRSSPGTNPCAGSGAPSPTADPSSAAEPAPASAPSSPSRVAATSSSSTTPGVSAWPA